MKLSLNVGNKEVDILHIELGTIENRENADLLNIWSNLKHKDGFVLTDASEDIENKKLLKWKHEGTENATWTISNNKIAIHFREDTFNKLESVIDDISLDLSELDDADRKVNTAELAFCTEDGSTLKREVNINAYANQMLALSYNNESSEFHEKETLQTNNKCKDSNIFDIPVIIDNCIYFIIDKSKVLHITTNIHKAEKISSGFTFEEVYDTFRQDFTDDEISVGFKEFVEELYSGTSDIEIEIK